MVMKRRSILKTALSAPLLTWFGSSQSSLGQAKPQSPVVISTWDHGMPANTAAWKILEGGGSPLTAAEEGVKVVESDPKVQTVGLGGRPDREGIVTLDACIMDGASGLCGAVAFLQDIENPISIARLIMEKTPHAMLVGKGARQFALAQGFKPKDLLTSTSKKEYEAWLKESKYQPKINIENHDTIGLLTLDGEGNLAGACTTSGAAYKMHGRVGDSPLIAAGLFVDNEVGAACATGLGEVVIRRAGSAMVVEAMRQGMDPQSACESIVKRIQQKESSINDLQVGFIALRKDGQVGAFSIQKGFTYAHKTNEIEVLLKAKSLL